MQYLVLRRPETSATDCLPKSYLILSTKRNRRLQRMPAVPVWSGSLDHQMNIGLPTMWSSGTKPQ